MRVSSTCSRVVETSCEASKAESTEKRDCLISYQEVLLQSSNQIFTPETTGAGISDVPRCGATSSQTPDTSAVLSTEHQIFQYRDKFGRCIAELEAGVPVRQQLQEPVLPGDFLCGTRKAGAYNQMARPATLTKSLRPFQQTSRSGCSSVPVPWQRGRRSPRSQHHNFQRRPNHAIVVLARCPTAPRSYEQCCKHRGRSRTPTFKCQRGGGPRRLPLRAPVLRPSSTP